MGRTAEAIQRLKAGEIYRYGTKIDAERNMVPAHDLSTELAFSLAATVQHQEGAGHRVAMSLYRTLGIYQPHHLAIFANMGAGWYAQGEFFEAIDSYTAAHHIQPGHVVPMVLLAELYSRGGNPAAAQRIMDHFDLTYPYLMRTKKVLEFNSVSVAPPDPAMWSAAMGDRMNFTKGMVAFQDGQYRRAARIWEHMGVNERSIERLTKSRILHYLSQNVGLAYYAMGKLSLAVLWWKKALELKKTGYEAHGFPEIQATIEMVTTWLVASWRPAQSRPGSNLDEVRQLIEKGDLEINEEVPATGPGGGRITPVWPSWPTPVILGEQSSAAFRKLEDSDKSSVLRFEWDFTPQNTEEIILYKPLANDPVRKFRTIDEQLVYLVDNAEQGS